MRRIIVIMITMLLLVIVTVKADIVTFQQLEEHRSDHVQGTIDIYNHLLNIWEPAPPGQPLMFKLESNTAPPVFSPIVYSQLTGSYYYNFTSFPPGYGPENYDVVRVEFRGSYYYGDFNRSATVNIKWIQAN